MSNDDRLYDLLIRWDELRKQGEEVSPEDLCKGCPELLPQLKERIGSLLETDWLERGHDEDGNSPIEPDDHDGIETSLSGKELCQRIIAGQILTTKQLKNSIERLPRRPRSGSDLLSGLVDSDVLTRFQASELCSDQPQPLVFGDYVILDRIGAGGMGQVFKARHRRMKRVVALKTLPSQAVETPQGAERFQREVEAAARLIHPNIVIAHDAGEANGGHFLVMEYIDGRNLAETVRAKGPLPAGVAVGYVLQAARGLRFAHENGVIHRDIKPSNLVVDHDGRVRILDMGLARLESSPALAAVEATQPELTHDGSVMGTVDYMSPEQALDSKHADNRADIYSLGCTLFFLLTGRPPFPGNSLMARMLAHRESEIPGLPARADIPRTLSAVFAKMVAKQPVQRYATAGEVIVALEEIAAAAPEGRATLPASTQADVPGEADSVVEQHSRDTSSVGLGSTLIPSPREPVTRETTPRRVRQRTKLLAAIAVSAVAFGGLLFWMFGNQIRIQTPDGIIEITTNVPDIDVFVDENKVVDISDPNDKTKVRVRIPKGGKKLRVAKGGFEADVPEFTIKTIKGPINVRFRALGEEAKTEREIAEWIIQNGGNISLQIGDVGPVAAYKVGELPPRPFTVIGVGFRNHPNLDLVAPKLNRMLAKLNHLEAVSLRGCMFSGSSLEALAGLTKMVELDLSYSSVSDADLRRIAGLEGLVHLSLENSYVKGDTLSQLKTRKLTRFGGPCLTDRGMQWLGDQSELERLYFLGGTLTDEGTKYLTKLTKLIHLQIVGESKCMTDGRLPFLNELTQLKSVSFRGAAVNGSGFQTVNLPRVESLGLSACPVDDEGLASVVEAASSSPKFDGLNLSLTKVTNEGLRHLTDSTVGNLDISGTSITDAGLQHLPKLYRLVITDTKVTEEGIAEYRKKYPKCEIVGADPELTPVPAIFEARQPLSGLAGRGTYIGVAGNQDPGNNLR